MLMLKQKIFTMVVKGAGGVRGRFSLFAVSDSDECQLLATFFGLKKYSYWPKLLHFEISKLFTITLRVRTLIGIPRKSTLKFINSYSF